MLTRVLAVLVLGFTGAPPAAAATLSWTRPVKVSRSVALAGVTCQSPSLCVAFGDAGRVFVSSEPSGGAVTWKVRHIDGSARLEVVSCPSESLCAAYDGGGNVLVSTHPLQGASTWRRIASDPGLDSFTCPSRSLCVGVDSTGNVISSTHPARAGSWRTQTAGDRSPTYECVHDQDPGECALMSLSDLSCPSPRICTALDQAGNVVLSTDPHSRDWLVAYAEPPDTASGLTAISCTSAHFCFGTDGWGNFLASADPAGGRSAWSATGLHTAGGQNGPDASLGHMITGAVCSSSSACIATNRETRLFATANPAGTAPAWRPTGLDAVNSMTCPGHGWCFASEVDGSIRSTDDPGRPHSWTRAFDDHVLSGVPGRFACLSKKLCVAVDPLGRVATGTVR